MVGGFKYCTFFKHVWDDWLEARRQLPGSYTPQRALRACIEISDLCPMETPNFDQKPNGTDTYAIGHVLIHTHQRAVGFAIIWVI